MSETVLIEVVFAESNVQHLVEIRVPAGATVGAAIRESGLQTEFPDYEFGDLTVGIWGKVTSLDQTVRAGDRVEIYRDLEVDPMEARRIRATAPDPGPS